jgi:hypothetical protein
VWSGSVGERTVKNRMDWCAMVWHTSAVIRTVPSVVKFLSPVRNIATRQDVPKRFPWSSGDQSFDEPTLRDEPVTRSLRSPGTISIVDVEQ